MPNALLLLPDFLLILVGFAICRWTLLGRPVWEGVERLVYYVLFPALLFTSIVKSPLHIGQTLKLAEASVGITLLAEDDGAGKLATTIFANASVTVKPVTEEADVKSTLAKVTTGAVDAGIVYVTDVKAAGDDVEGIEIPADQNATTQYPIATLTGTQNADLAAAFTEYVLSDDGRQVLTDAGFAAP